jgi:hypothetical protein
VLPQAIETLDTRSIGMFSCLEIEVRSASSKTAFEENQSAQFTLKVQVTLKPGDRKSDEVGVYVGAEVLDTIELDVTEGLDVG